MLCRVAEDVLWMSRYVERSLAVGRLIEVSQHLEFDEHDDPAMRAARWAPLLEPRPNDGPLPSQVAMVAVEREAARTVRQWLAFNRESTTRAVGSCDWPRSSPTRNCGTWLMFRSGGRDREERLNGARPSSPNKANRRALDVKCPAC